MSTNKARKVQESRISAASAPAQPCPGRHGPQMSLAGALSVGAPWRRIACHAHRISGGVLGALKGRIGWPWVDAACSARRAPDLQHGWSCWYTCASAGRDTSQVEAHGVVVDGMAHEGQVHTNLMPPAGRNLHLEVAGARGVEVSPAQLCTLAPAGPAPATAARCTYAAAPVDRG